MSLVIIEIKYTGKICIKNFLKVSYLLLYAENMYMYLHKHYSHRISLHIHFAIKKNFFGLEVLLIVKFKSTNLLSIYNKNK